METETLDHDAPPLHGFRGDTLTLPPLTRPRGLTVAVSRQAGACGEAIAKRVGELLEWQVFSRDNLDLIVGDEAARADLLAEIPPFAQDWANAQLARLQLERKTFALDEHTLAMLRLMLTLAARGEVVLVGRGAGFVLPSESSLHVRIVAPDRDRVAYMADWLRLTPDESAHQVAALDDRRAAFLRRLTSRDPNDVAEYDLVINSSRFSVDVCAGLIAQAVRAHHANENDDATDDVEPA